MRYFDFIIPVGGVFNLSARGDFFRYYSGSAGGADETIIVRGVDTGNTVMLKPGQSVRFNEPETRWELLNYAGISNISGFVVIGAGEIWDDRVTGEVSVVNGEAEKVKAGLCFTIGASCGVVAGQYSHVQLWNPNNLRNIVVKSITLSASVTGHRVHLRSSVAALANLSQNGQNKLVNGLSDGPRSARYENSAALIGSFLSLGFAPVGMQKFDLEDPFVIPPNNGLIVASSVVGLELWGHFEYYLD